MVEHPTTDQSTGRHTRPSDSPGAGWVPKVGVWAWSFVGVVVAVIIVVAALAAVSEIALPLTFAAVLAVIFKPAVGVLCRHRLRPTIAAGVVVLGLLGLVTGVVVATVRGVADQADEIGASVDAALDNAEESLNLDEGFLDDSRSAIENLGPSVRSGFLTEVVSGLGALVGLAGGIILGALTLAARSVTTVRGRTVMSAIVSVVIGLAALLLGLPLVFTIMVVNFIGGYIPYIGAFLGGGLAVIVALGEEGLGTAAVMLVVVLAANLLLENFVEPKVMGNTLDVHPVIVLIVTALGGLIGGIVGLILAVPFYVIARNAIARLRSRGVVDIVAGRAETTVHGLLQ